MKLEENKTVSYYAVIPASVRYDKRLCANEKLLYSEISALTNAYGKCWASNEYFSSLYDVSLRTVSRWVTNLQRCGHINVKMLYDKREKKVNERIITLTDCNTKGCRQKRAKDVDKNVHDNNTSNKGSARSKNEREPYNPYMDIADDLEEW